MWFLFMVSENKMEINYNNKKTWRLINLPMTFGQVTGFGLYTLLLLLKCFTLTVCTHYQSYIILSHIT